LVSYIKEKHRLREFERIFGSKRDEVIGIWEELHNAELHNSYCLPDIKLTIAQSV
jgi:hypothetical protein